MVKQEKPVVPNCFDSFTVFSASSFMCARFFSLRDSALGNSVGFSGSITPFNELISSLKAAISLSKVLDLASAILFNSSISAKRLCFSVF